MISQRVLTRLENGSPILSVFEDAKRLRALWGNDRVFDLSIGNPCAPAPKEVREAALKLWNDPDLNHHYTGNPGLIETRKIISESLNKRFNANCRPEDIIMTAGASEGLSSVICTLLESGDEAIVFLPYYPAYVNYIENWGAKAVFVKPEGSKFQPDLNELEQSITERTKLIIVNSPHNPTGTVYTLKTAQGISEILTRKQQLYKHPIYLLSDEPYRELIYDGSQVVWWPSVYDNSIVVYSFSKSLSLPGERIGYTLVSPQADEASKLIHAFKIASGLLGYVNAPVFFQRLVSMCLNSKVDLEYYDKNRKILYGAVHEFGFEASEPQGAFYIFVKSPLSSESEFLELARNRGLLFVGGSAFGMEGYARLSFCGDYEMLERAIPALKLLASDCGLIK